MSSDATRVVADPEIERQAAYHGALFAGLSDWDHVWTVAMEMIGDAEAARGFGLDQMGLLGPRGVSLVVDQLLKTSDGSLDTVVELGSGFGGTLRQAARELRAQGREPRLIGVEIVPQHCELADRIGKALGDTGPRFVNGDVRRLPLRSASADAIFVSGSASHFDAMDAVLAESRRVLRPGGVLVMTEEVSLQPDGAPSPGDAFANDHPFARLASTDRRREHLVSAGLTVEKFQSIAEWATALLRQRVMMLRLLSECANKVYGPDKCEMIVGTLISASDAYARGSIQPTVIVARATSS